MKNSEYWKNRFVILEQAQLDKGISYYEELERNYKTASSEIEKQISTWYARFAKNNNISFAEAKKLLNSNELKEFRWTVEEYIKHGEENALTQEWLKQLENASAKLHVSRLEALQVQMQQQIEILFCNQTDGFGKLIKDIYSDGYYHTAFEIQKGFNLGWSLQPFNNTQLEKVSLKPWTADSRTWRDKCWTSKAELTNIVHTELTQNIIRGSAPDRAINVIQKQFDVAKNKAGRLVMTESAYFASDSQKQCFNDLGIKKYEIVATLDMKTSEICQELDGKICDMKDYQAGVTAPPFHPWCRTTTCPSFDDDFGERAARGAVGKTYYVPSDMKFKDWKEKFIKDNPENKFDFEKHNNLNSDKIQFNNYKQILGKDFPKTIAEFQEMKYNNSGKWNEYKANYRKINAYNKIIQNEPEITKDLKDISESTGVGMMGLEYRLKTKESFLRKVNTDSESSLDLKVITDTITSTNDVIRYTYHSSADDLANAYDKVLDGLLAKDYSKVKVKNTWINKYIEYKGINCTFKHPNGQNFEIQFHTPESFALKNGELHKLYEKYRVLPKDSDEAIALKKQMFALSKELTIPTNIERVK